MEFSKSTIEADYILDKGQLMAKGKSMAEAGIDVKWMVVYGEIAERKDRDRNFCLSRYSYELGPDIEAFVDGFLDNRDWMPCKALRCLTTMRAVREYEAKYMKKPDNAINSINQQWIFDRHLS